MRFDLFGLALSGACLVHCLALPVALVAAPTLAIWLGETETRVHWTLFAVALAVSGWALYSGYRHHRAAQALWLGAAGLALMAVAAAHLFGSAAEALVTLTGAGVLAVAHLVNLRSCARAVA